jgi:hypothetical protein
MGNAHRHDNDHGQRTAKNLAPYFLSYDYAGAAWAFDDSELVKTKKKTWNQWRGYRTVTMKTGEAGSKQLRTETTYLQGMDGDRERESGGTKSVTVTASDGTKIRPGDRSGTRAGCPAR